MFWGCIHSPGERLLVSIKDKVDTEIYIPMLKENVVNFLCMHEPFQHDNAPADSASKTKHFFGENEFKILQNWPAQSPDINIIQNL